MIDQKVVMRFIITNFISFLLVVTIFQSLFHLGKWMSPDHAGKNLVISVACAVLYTKFIMDNGMIVIAEELAEWLAERFTRRRDGE